MKTNNSISFMLGAAFAVYFMIYPILYFVWNWAIAEIGMPQFQIPGFWVGMAFYLIFNIIKNNIKGIFK